MSFVDIDVQQRYDGIWCCASLLHVPASDLHEVMQKLTHALKPGGVCYVSFKYGDGEREKDGRRFTDMNERSFTALLKNISAIEAVEQWLTQDKRPDRDETWLNAVLCRF